MSVIPYNRNELEVKGLLPLSVKLSFWVVVAAGISAVCGKERLT